MSSFFTANKGHSIKSFVPDERVFNHLNNVKKCFYFSLDCGNPTESAGYTLAATPGSTVEGATATVQCATGYTGTAASITCQSSGSWTAFSGCTASGKSTH